MESFNTLILNDEFKNAFQEYKAAKKPTDTLDMFLNTSKFLDLFDIICKVKVTDIENGLLKVAVSYLKRWNKTFPDNGIDIAKRLFKLQS